jgi:hypothetical protein
MRVLCLYLCIYGRDVLSCLGVLLIISENIRGYAQLAVELNKSSGDRALAWLPWVVGRFLR